MSTERNVGGLDRMARAALGTGLVVVAAIALLAGRGTVALGAALASSGLLFNAVVGWCGVNALLRIDTWSRE
ncbi:DUF2892 domain-containing protein [Halobacteriales archaeon QS_8_65_32]|jgi:hypothetical protein|nr:MAG: DUF2892 domain-containing protein [Halobacteriales archaeon QS_8_65_32]